MWQNIVVILVVLIAAYYVVRHLWASVSARGECGAEGCGDCPFAQECEEPKQPRRKQKSGCGCGCQ